MPAAAKSAAMDQPSTKMPSIGAAVADPAWIAHRYDPEYDVVHLLHVPRETQRRAIFLTEEYLPNGLEPMVLRRADAIAVAPPPAPLHFIFHSAYCCSTLVARAFDRPGWAMGLKEPLIFNDIVGWRRRGGQGPDMASVLDDTLTLLARPYGPGEAVVVKPSNVANILAAPILTLRPNARALLLRAPLRTYLASVAKKEMDGRLWVRTLLLGLLDDGAIDLGFTTRDYLGHTDLQAAAVGWLAQQAIFQVLAERFGPTRVRTLDSETLTRDPAAAMGSLATFFGLPLDAAELTDMVSGPAFTRHSKFGTDFATADRAEEHRAASETHADEIEKVAIWAEIVAQGAGIRLDPPAPLITGNQGF